MTPVSYISLSDGELARKAANGDEDAFEILFASHRRKVLSTILWTLRGSKGGDVDAEDLLQEVFLRAYRCLAEFTGDQMFGAWLYRIAVNAAYDLLRKRKRQKEVPLDSPADDRKSHKEAIDPCPSPEKVTVRIDLLEVLTDLDPNLLQILLEKHSEGLSHEEIAKRHGVPLGTAKVKYQRATRHVQRLLKERGLGL